MDYYYYFISKFQPAKHAYYAFVCHTAEFFLGLTVAFTTPIAYAASRLYSERGTYAIGLCR